MRSWDSILCEMGALEGVKHDLIYEERPACCVENSARDKRKMG